MIISFKKFFYVFFILTFTKVNKNFSFNNLNFRKIDFTNYRQIKLFIFKENFIRIKNKYVQNFDFLNYSKKLGGKIGINLSKKSIFDWYEINKNKLNFPWSEDLSTKRLINIIYNYEYINSSSTYKESYKLNKIIVIHIRRIYFDFNNKKITQLTSFDLLAYILSLLILNKLTKRKLSYIKFIIFKQIDNLGMHKSYNLLEHSKFINNLSEIKSILLFYKVDNDLEIDKLILKMSSILNQYFHKDGSMPLFNGSNNNYTDSIFKNLNKDVFLKSRDFSKVKNGIAFHSSKNKKLFFDVVQPNKDRISSNLSAGTLSIEISGFGEKIFTNCGASESFGKNPEYLRYSAAHSTIILQNTNISEIKEDNPHLKFPQSVEFNSSSDEEKDIFEGSHNGYLKKFNKILKRKITTFKNKDHILGEDSFISLKNYKTRIIYHIRFHLSDGITYNFTNSKKSIILKTSLSNIWLFETDSELIVEDSILVDKNITKPTKQVVMKGVITDKKLIKKWSLKKI